MHAHRIGFMANPGSYYTPDTIRSMGVWAADNGCFNEQWDPDHWLDWLHKMRDVPGCLFAVVPDKVADAEVTRQMFSDWAALVTDLGYRPAYVAQNGATCASIPWDDIACVFIGGDTDWKLGHQAEAITRHAKQLGKWVHMGRVNSLRRMRIAESWGVDSCDGTFLKFGPDINIRRLTAMLNDVNTAPSLLRPVKHARDGPVSPSVSPR
jgi:hypothetical protein